MSLQGPAVAWVERAFKEVWDTTGAPLPPEELTAPEAIATAGDVSVRIIAGRPTSTDLFRLDQVIATAAQRTLWLTDAYFVGYIPYVQALHHWQQRLNRVTELDEDPFDAPVNLDDIVKAAKEIAPKADADWH